MYIERGYVCYKGVATRLLHTKTMPQPRKDIRKGKGNDERGTLRRRVGMGSPSQGPLAHLAGSRRRRVLECALGTRLGRHVYRGRGRRRGAIAHRVVRQRLGRPPAGEQRPAKPAAVRLAPLGRRFRVRLEKLLVLLFLAQIEDIIRQDAQRRHARAVVRQLVALIEQPLTDGRNVQLLLQLPMRA